MILSKALAILTARRVHQIWKNFGINLDLSEESSMVWLSEERKYTK